MSVGRSIRQGWETVKPYAEIAAWLIASGGAIYGFGRDVVHAVQGWAAPYLSLLAPYAWVVKYILLIAAVFLSIRVGRLWRERFSFLRILQSHRTLVLADAAGHTATLVESTQVRADVDGIEHYEHAIWSRGGHDTPKIEVHGYHCRMPDSADIQAGMEVYQLTFEPPMPKGTTVWQRFECTMNESFTRPREFMEYEMQYRAKNFTLEVIFPPERLPARASAQVVRGVFVRREQALEVQHTADGRPRVLWKIRRPQIGISYRIEWDW